VAERRSLFVCGAPRSGTKYIAQVWQQLGLKIGHEYVDDDGTSSHYFLTTTLRYPEKNKRQVHVGQRPGDFEFDHVFHQVRHPVLVIDSMQWIPGHSKMLKAYGITPPKNPLAKVCCAYWLFNRLCEQQPVEIRYRIEDIDQELPRLCRVLGVPAPARTPDVSRTLNHDQRYDSSFTAGFGKVVRGKIAEWRRKVDNHPPITWGHIQAATPEWAPRIRSMAEQYGYDVEAPPGRAG
jgi:hypothetical protein